MVNIKTGGAPELAPLWHEIFPEFGQGLGLSFEQYLMTTTSLLSDLCPKALENFQGASWKQIEFSPKQQQQKCGYSSTSTPLPPSVPPYCLPTNIPGLWQGCQPAVPQLGGVMESERATEGERKRCLLCDMIFECANSSSGWGERTKGRTKEKWVGGEWNRCIKEHEHMVWGLEGKTHSSIQLLLFSGTGSKTHSWYLV